MLALPSLPDWLPPVIAEWIKSVDPNALDQEQLDALRRLVTDADMKQVWDDLRGRQPVCSRALLEADLEDIDCPIANLSDSELALLAALPVWFTAPTWDIQVSSAVQLKADIKSHEERAARLRRDANELPFPLYEQVRKAADWYDEEAKRLSAIDPADRNERIVQRNHGFLRQIDLVQALICQMQGYYGEPLFPIVTIIANVLTDKQITSQQVRDWHKQSREWRY